MNSSTFDCIWSTLIQPTYNKMESSHGGIYLADTSYQDIKLYYSDAINYAKEHYMRDASKILNRHKVSAAVMIAILKSKPIKKINAMYYQVDQNGHPSIWTFNEHLAITVALSILRSFIEARVDFAFSKKIVSRAIFEDVCLEDRDIFKDGIPISSKERSSWEHELYQIRQDGAYNLLSFAHILSGIEERARLKYFLEHPDKQPTHPDPQYLTDEPVEMLTIDDIF